MALFTLCRGVEVPGIFIQWPCLLCVQVLEDIMRSHEDDVEFYKVPPVGKHYSEKWAHEDMLEEQRQGEMSTEF